MITATEGFPLGLALLAGVGLGLFYFGGLWLTVQQLLTTRRPVALLLVSYVPTLSLGLPRLFGLM